MRVCVCACVRACVCVCVCVILDYSIILASAEEGSLETNASETATLLFRIKYRLSTSSSAGIM